MYITELFKEFQKNRLKEAKPTEHDYIQEVYAKTELFDISNVKEEDFFIDLEEFRKTLSYTLPLKFFSLPFENCFIKMLADKQKSMDEEICVFLREYSPNILTGTVALNYKVNEHILKYNLPFTIHLFEDNCVLTVNKDDYFKITNAIDNVDLFNEKMVINRINQIIELNTITGKKSDIDGLYKDVILDKFAEMRANMLYVIESALLYGISSTQKVFEKLSKHEILIDKNENMKPEYYTFKNKNKKTIKVTNRPIYYVLNKEDYEKKNFKIKPLGKLEYSHAFKVRGHWRKIDEKSIGKDRNGDYKIQGFTWVIDYIKGDGELVNRVRIVR